jgi:hypothetical protein
LFGNTRRFYRHKTASALGTHVGGIGTMGVVQDPGANLYCAGYFRLPTIYGWEDPDWMWMAYDDQTDPQDSPIGSLAPNTWNGNQIYALFYVGTAGPATGVLRPVKYYVLVLSGNHQRNDFTSLTVNIGGRTDTVYASNALWDSAGQIPDNNDYFGYFGGTQVTVWTMFASPGMTVLQPEELTTFSATIT